MFSSADLSLAAGKMRNNQFVTGGFGYDFKESQAASCKHFSVSKLSRLWCGLLEGSSQLVISKEQAKTLRLIFSSTREHKIAKNYQRMYRKYLFIVISLQKKYLFKLMKNLFLMV
jgi:hypothetical protein